MPCTTHWEQSPSAFWVQRRPRHSLVGPRTWRRRASPPPVTTMPLNWDIRSNFPDIRMAIFPTIPCLRQLVWDEAMWVRSGCGRDSAFGSSLLCKDQGRYLRDSSWWETTGINVCRVCSQEVEWHPTRQFNICYLATLVCRHRAGVAVPGVTCFGDRQAGLSPGHTVLSPSHPTMVITPRRSLGCLLC